MIAFWKGSLSEPELGKIRGRLPWGNEAHRLADPTGPGLMENVCFRSCSAVSGCVCLVTLGSWNREDSVVATEAQAL